MNKITDSRQKNLPLFWMNDGLSIVMFDRDYVVGELLRAFELPSLKKQPEKCFAG
jgi:hypothetical protein